MSKTRWVWMVVTVLLGVVALSRHLWPTALGLTVALISQVADYYRVRRGRVEGEAATSAAIKAEFDDAGDSRTS